MDRHLSTLLKFVVPNSTQETTQLLYLWAIRILFFWVSLLAQGKKKLDKRLTVENPLLFVPESLRGKKKRLFFPNILPKEETLLKTVPARSSSEWSGTPSPSVPDCWMIAEGLMQSKSQKGTADDRGWYSERCPLKKWLMYHIRKALLRYLKGLG